MARKPKPRPSAPSLAIFTPLPPMRTGIGDYTFELLPLLAARYRCTVIAEDAIPDLRVPPGVDLIRLAEHNRSPQPYDATLYMIGNNPDHLYMLPALAACPGVVVLHDPGLHHLLDCATAALGDADGYCAAIEADYGAPGRLLAEHWRAHNLRDQQMLYRMPMLRHILGPARHVIVHSRTAALIALTQAPDTPVTIAPHAYTPPQLRSPRGTARARLGIGADEVVFLSLGFVSHIKRIDSALRALARIAGRLPPFRYVIAGELRPEEVDVERMIRTLGLTSHVLMTGYVAEEDFFPLIDMADVVINLRYPVSGETSGTLIRTMGSGACVVVTDAGPFAELPDGAAIRLPWGSDFETLLADTLLRLALFPAAREQIGAAAAAYVQTRHHPQATLAAYTAAIESARSTSPHARRWRAPSQTEFAPPQALAAGLPAAAPLWRRAGALPLPTQPSLLAIAGPADCAMLDELGFAPVVAAETWRPEEQPARGFDQMFLALNHTDALRTDADLLPQLNRILTFGGWLALHISADPHAHALAARWSGEPAFRAAGFRVDLATAAAAPSMFDDQPPPEPGMVWRAVKVSEFQNPRHGVAAAGV